MAILTRNALRNLFKTGLRPIQQNYHDWIDSYFHKSDAIPIASVENLSTTIQQFVTNQQFNSIANLLLPISDSLAAGSKTITIGSGKLLELVVIETSANTQINISYGSTVLIDELIDATTAFRLDTFLVNGSDITITSSLNITFKIYSR